MDQSRQTQPWSCPTCGHTQAAGRFCAVCGAAWSAAGPPDGARAGEDDAAVTGRAALGRDHASTTRARAGRAVVGLVVLLALGIGVGLAATGGRGFVASGDAAPEAGDGPVLPDPMAEPEPPPDRPPDAEPGPPAHVPEDVPPPPPLLDPTWPVDFLGDTGSLLVLDDGFEGATVLEVDTGRVAWTRLGGQRPGDAPYRLWELDDRVVVGWGEIHLTSPGSDTSRWLGDATVFLPAAEPDLLWLIDTADGTFPGAGATWYLVDGAGNALVTVDASEIDAEPVRGVPGGLAVRREDGSLAVYEVDRDAIRPLVDETTAARLDAEPRHLIDATADRVLWCDEPCDALYLNAPGGGLGAEVSGGDVVAFDPQATWLAPGGERVVTAAMVRVEDGRDRRLRVYGPDTNTLLAQAPIPLGWMQGAWRDDGRQFFFTLVAEPVTDPDAPQRLGSWRVGGGIQQLDLRPRLSATGALVALPTGAVDHELFER